MFDYIRRFKYIKSENVPSDEGSDVITCDSYSDEELGKIKISADLTDNINLINKILNNNSDLVIRKITLGKADCRVAAIFYIENLIDSDKVDNDIIRPLSLDANISGFTTSSAIIGQIKCGNLITKGKVKTSDNMKDFMYGLLNGNACLLISGLADAYLIGAKGNNNRSISEPQNEPTIRGPRDAFVETLGVNIGLIRKRIQSPNLSAEIIDIGVKTHTKVCITYLRGVCPPSRVEEVRSRLKKINIDGILESGYLEEFIQDNPYSIFPQIRNTERPDVASGALLEGRVAIITDNTPIVMIVPGEFFSLLQSSGDYYDRYIFSSFIRILRFITLLIATFMPAFYIAVTNYHKEMIPTSLLMGIASARTGVPLPTALEALAMNFAFELLYEAGVRLPKSLGQTISIVGALIIGEAAVQAKLVSPLMVIVISITGIATFCIPQYNVVLPIRILRFIFIILASVMGLFGMMIGILYLLLHLSTLRSFGVAYLMPLFPLDLSGLKDSVIRSPWWGFVKRPDYISANANRMKAGQKPKPPETGNIS